jgi:tetratricopeptide (TPR) repeat protein
MAPIVQLLLLALLTLAATGRAEDTSGPFDQANRLYEEGKYREAAEAYGKLATGGKQSPALWFNLGNAHFKAGHLGEAIAAYHQAERLAPRDPDIRANLDFARQRVGGPTLKPGRLERWGTELTTNEWTLLALLPVWAWFAAMIAVRLKPAWRRPLRNTLFATGAFSLAACGVLAAVLHYRFSSRTVVVTERNTVVRYGPFGESQSAFSAADGAELRVLDTKNDWLQVSAGGKIVGWVKSNAVVSVN